MKNSVLCPDCQTENPFYNLVCTNCRTYLRERIYNLDLFTTISSIIENPSKGFKTIIFSEHKNFIFFILLIVSLKYLINARFISMLSLGGFQSTISLHYSFLIMLGLTVIFFTGFSWLYTFTAKNKSFISYKDTFAIIIYSQIPYAFGIIILFTLELVLFGDYLFSKNPTPFVIKGFFAYLFLLLELSTVVWSAILVLKGFLVQTKQKLFSIIASIIFFVLFCILIYFCSLFVFTI
jgi:hypothetical protein